MPRLPREPLAFSYDYRGALRFYDATGPEWRLVATFKVPSGLGGDPLTACVAAHRPLVQEPPLVQRRGWAPSTIAAAPPAADPPPEKPAPIADDAPAFLALRRLGFNPAAARKALARVQPGTEPEEALRQALAASAAV